MTLTATKAKTRLPQLLEETQQSHRPIVITGKHANAVLISEEDWNAIQETLYLNEFPGLVESIHEAAKEPLEEGTPLEELAW